MKDSFAVGTFFVQTLQKATDKLPEVELNLGFEYIIYYKQDRKKKKKVFKLHGKPFIRLKLFLLATEAFNTCNQRRLIKKLYDIPFSFICIKAL